MPHIRMRGLPEDAVASLSRKAITLAYPQLQHLAVMFNALDPSRYYCDGKHF
ncbi:Phosphatidylserine synthase [Shewanella benthica]|uniref:Phosphatidylserine synthase n=1 Tax=Shewanella benthica TaxID=43661 RepID=A0A330M3R6_9GAMM|nr:DUF1904 family protein [Shewanella benthica]SQH76738.1 Phosphatidylserine synthase [Shewanella benthica]